MHALMLAVMVGAMLSHSALASIGGAALLVVVSVPCSALSRTRAFFRAHVLDLWAMALALLAMVSWQPGGHHHGLAVPSGAALAGIVVAWAAGRVWLGMRGPAGARRAAAASGAVTGAGLAVMAVLCLV